MTEIDDLVADLAAAFRQELSPGTVAVWLRELADLQVDVLEAAVRTLIRTSEFFPSLAKVRAAAAELTLRLPGEADALAQVAAVLAWARADEDTRPAKPPPPHPLVREALDHVGGWHAFRAADEPAVIRGQFGRLYRELRARAITNAQTGDLR